MSQQLLPATSTGQGTKQPDLPLTYRPLGRVPAVPPACPAPGPRSPPLPAPWLTEAHSSFPSTLCLDPNHSGRELGEILAPWLPFTALARRLPLSLFDVEGACLWATALLSHGCSKSLGKGSFQLPQHPKA